VTITGNDTGQLGTAPLDEIATALVRERPLELFVDLTVAIARHVSRTVNLIQIYSDADLFASRLATS
jgi:hypothetical protein